MSYVFFIEYTTGQVSEEIFETAKQAEKAYLKYNEHPEVDAKGWGWEEVYEEGPTLKQKIRSNKKSKYFEYDEY